MAATVDLPTTDEMIGRARELVPLLKSRAGETERLRRVPDENIDAFRRAGLFRIFVPKRYGGYQMDYATTQLVLCTELGCACGSSAWVQSVLAIHGWVVGMFPKAAQDDAWGTGPDTPIASAYTASTGTATPVDGGYILNGDWQFSSGVHAGEWLTVMAALPVEGGINQFFFLVPKKDWTILDTWYAPGLRGTGTNDVRLTNAVVPASHVLNVSLSDGRATPGSKLHDSYLYRLPIFSVFSWCLGPPAIGIARGALDAFIAHSAARPDRAGSPVRQLRIAKSAAEIDAAEALLEKNAAAIDRGVAARQSPSPQQRAKWRRDMAFAVALCVRAVGRLSAVMGAHGMIDQHPVQRAARDVNALANHTGLVWDIQGLFYAKLALGLDPLEPGAPLPL